MGYQCDERVTINDINKYQVFWIKVNDAFPQVLPKNQKSLRKICRVMFYSRERVKSQIVEKRVQI